MNGFGSGAGHLNSWRAGGLLPRGGDEEMAPNWATSVGVSETGTRSLDALLSGTRWSGTITYSFPDSRSDYETGYAEAADAFTQVSFAQRQAAPFILDGHSPYS